MSDKTELVVVPTHEETEPVFELAVGQWYWVKDDDQKDVTWLGCITHIGSNYAQMQGVGWSQRVHLDEFYEWCKEEPNARGVIDKEVASKQAKVQELMGKVQEITERLALSPDEQLPEASSHTQALATTVLDPNEHKAALIKAKDEDLPALFEEIQKTNKSLARWMTAPTIPLKAKAEGMTKVVKVIEQRIFHVELYAGLLEEVIQVKDGKPAHKREKLKLLQRRHYMDEECLIDYQAGGMEFKSLKAFDKWLKKKKNLDRLLPFPRCVVAFRVRRMMKDREFDGSLSAFISIQDKEPLDKLTFLYIRNGQQVYRLNTKIEFGDKLFPDLDHSRLEGKLWVSHGHDGTVIDQNRYDGMGEDYEREMKEHRRKKREYKKAQTTLAKDDEYHNDLKLYRKSYAGDAAKRRALDNLLRRNGFHEPSHFAPRNDQDSYRPFDRSNLHYDDATEKWAEELAEHNKIALILQGLFDRSPVLHPHPKVRLWTPDGFEDAIDLVYDQDRALVAGDKPDFEAYRAKCNESLKTGSVTIGQGDLWLLHEGEKYKARYWRDKYPPKRHSPHGNPGPGILARVERFQPRVRKCVYAWMRERMKDTGWPRFDHSPIRTTFTVEAGQIFNVDAYKPGDFRQFFEDPRTRAEYLKWAPFLLRAEDYHAGKGLKVGEGTDGW